LPKTENPAEAGNSEKGINESNTESKPKISATPEKYKGNGEKKSENVKQTLSEKKAANPTPKKK